MEEIIVSNIKLYFVSWEEVGFPRCRPSTIIKVGWRSWGRLPQEKTEISCKTRYLQEQNWEALVELTGRVLGKTRKQRWESSPLCFPRHACRYHFRAPRYQVKQVRFKKKPALKAFTSNIRCYGCSPKGIAPGRKARKLGGQESRIACPVEIYSNRSILQATYAIKTFPITTF